MVPRGFSFRSCKVKCDVLTIFPDIIHAYLNESIVRRAREKGKLDARVYDIRDFAPGRHSDVDDYPFGGGAGMVFKPEPLFRAVESIREDGAPRKVIYLSPQGRPFDQSMAEKFAREEERLLLICGRYEGVDERVVSSLVDEEVSIGDYVITGGELAALVIIDSAVRLMPGVLGDESSIDNESFSWGLLDYPHYTRPRVFRGLTVPGVLLSGNHEDIRIWRRKEALRKTMRMRPDIIEKAELAESDMRLLSEIKEEEDGRH